jgi:FtsP/CotA-like multicopper oxidase with cupredoxin domain
MRRTLAVLAVLLCVLIFTTGCGEDPSGGGSGSTSASNNATEDAAEPTQDAAEPTQDAAEPKVVAVTIEGDSVTPNGERIEVATGQDVQLDLTADAPGEIHVHSTPEQELEYDEGTSSLTIEGMERPGTVDVEVHDLEKIIVQLEVS